MASNASIRSVSQSMDRAPFSEQPQSCLAQAESHDPRLVSTKIFVAFAFRRCGEILCVMCQPSDWCWRLSVLTYMPGVNTALAQTVVTT
jgi:hypothetical protein